MTGRGKTITLVAMTLASSMILVDQTAVPLATSHAVSELGGSLDEGQWILTANILPLAALMIVGGQLGDRYGLRKIFLLGAVLFACATATAASSVNMTMMITARVAKVSGRR